MKKKASLLICCFACLAFYSVHAQNNKVVSAKMHFDEYTQDPSDTGALSDAKAAIDMAATNDKTKDEPKMWLYRGDIYRSLFEKNLATEVKKHIAAEGSNKGDATKYTAEAYASVDTAALSTAIYSYLQVIKIEPDKAYADDARRMLPLCSQHAENKATSDFSAQKYAMALSMFEKALMLGRAQGLKDTSAFIIQNIQNCAITADRMHDNAKALMYYQKLIDMKIGKAEPYSSMVNIYAAMNDTTHEMDILRKGRAAYPDDVNLLISETNYYLQSGKTNQAIDNLQKTIDKITALNKPENNGLLSNLYFVLGNTYDRMANPKDDKGNPLAKPANYDDLFPKAETNYKKALALTPDSFDQNYDLGALYNNRATAINKEANDLPLDQTDKFNKLQAEANVYLKDAQPWLEKALALARTELSKAQDAQSQKEWNDNVQATIIALKQIYASTNQTDKIKGLTQGK